MSQPDTLVCMACGFEGRRDREVKLGLVEYDDPIPVEVAIPIDPGVHGPRGFEFAMVPGRYGAEQRCVDRTACAQRVKANEISAFFEGSTHG